MAHRLAQAGTPAVSVRTDATVWLRVVSEAPAITKIDLVTVGQVPGIDQSAFAEHAKAGKEECPVSVALAGVHEINLDAILAT